MKDSTKKGIDLYVSSRVPPGDFLRAVLANDLANAVGRADEDNLRDIAEIVRYVWNEIPANCWGSRERVQRWLDREAQDAAHTCCVCHVTPVDSDAGFDTCESCLRRI